MTETIEREGLRGKRLLVPITAIVLCAVAMVGVGYALTSEVSNAGNTVGYDDLLTIDLYSDKACESRVTEKVFDDAAVESYTKADQNGIQVIYVAGSDVRLNAGDVYIKASAGGTLTVSIDVPEGDKAPFTDITVRLTEVGNEANVLTGSTSSADSGISVTGFEADTAYSVVVTASWTEVADNPPFDGSFDVTFSVSDS